MKNLLFILVAIFIMGTILFSGCNGDVREVKMGDTVKVHYTLKLEDGSVYQTTLGGEPAEFTLGNNSLIAGFENALLGMKVGEKKTVNIPSDLAYGPYIEDLVIEVPFDLLGGASVPEVGQRFQQELEDGTIIVAFVTEVRKDSVILDANYPLAGKDLIYEIELLGISRN
jgi:peptidylprolyl isomerase